MTAQELIEYLQGEPSAEVLVDGKPIVAVSMKYGEPIELTTEVRHD